MALAATPTLVSHHPQLLETSRSSGSSRRPAELLVPPEAQEAGWSEAWRRVRVLHMSKHWANKINTANF